MAKIEPPDDLLQLQRASDAAWAAVRENSTPEAWAAWRDRSAESQAAVTEWAKEHGHLRNEVEAAVKLRVRHPEPADA
ncbi:hypothetical protein [Streptomyces subrutilus]|uniref:hypothetical protein n=1 Tax=Streptomyces subrutilus TaxID=36818 RepID=UPI002E1077B3|nr:hypothetical protein OG479_32860 [Streptomyces subrutilus]